MKRSIRRYHKSSWYFNYNNKTMHTNVSSCVLCIAKNLMVTGIGDQLEIQISPVIGKNKPAISL